MPISQTNDVQQCIHNQRHQFFDLDMLIGDNRSDIDSDYDQEGDIEEGGDHGHDCILHFTGPPSLPVALRINQESRSSTTRQSRPSSTIPISTSPNSTTNNFQCLAETSTASTGWPRMRLSP